MIQSITKTILSNLMCSPDFINEFLSHIEEDYFNDPEERAVFKELSEYWRKFKQLPSKNAIVTALQQRIGFTEQSFKRAVDVVTGLNLTPDPSDWLYETTD